MKNTFALYQREQHLTHHSLDVNNIGRYKLCFQVGKNTCHIVAFDIRSQQCVLFEKYTISEGEHTAEQKANAFKKMVEKHHFLPAAYWQNINFIVQNQSFSFIPSEFFDLDNVLKTLELNTKVDRETNHIQYSEHFERELMSVFTTPKVFSDWLERLYPNSTIIYSHYTSAFLEGVLRQNSSYKKHELHLLVQENTLVVLILNEHGLEFINAFQVEQPQDCLYFILSTIKNLKLSQDQVEIIFYGDILENSLTVGLLNRYIPKISFGNSPKDLLFGEGFDEELAPHQYFGLFSSHFID